MEATLGKTVAARRKNIGKRERDFVPAASQGTVGEFLLHQEIFDEMELQFQDDNFHPSEKCIFIYSFFGGWGRKERLNNNVSLCLVQQIIKSFCSV